jgi:hypothetical protein
MNFKECDRKGSSPVSKYYTCISLNWLSKSKESVCHELRCSLLKFEKGISRVHVGSHTFLSLLARLMALGYWKLNVGSSRETHELECRNYVKRVRTSAKGLLYCGFISALTDTRMVYGLQLQVPLHSLPAVESCDKGDTSF